MEVHIEAAAKLNLHLQVGEIRKDGIHDIVSIFHLVDLSDSLIIRSGGKPGSVVIGGNFGFPEKENILYKATLLYFDVWKKVRGTEPAFGVAVECFKRIPLGGGLGGGSSNAAALLKGLEILSGNPLGKERLFPIAEDEAKERRKEIANEAKYSNRSGRYRIILSCWFFHHGKWIPAKRMLL